MLPRLPGVTALVPLGPTTGVNVCSAEKADGCRPAAPYAARRRSVLNRSLHFQNGSSLTTHDALALG